MQLLTNTCAMALLLLLLVSTHSTHSAPASEAALSLSQDSSEPADLNPINAEVNFKCKRAYNNNNNKSNQEAKQATVSSERVQQQRERGERRAKSAQCKLVATPVAPLSRLSPRSRAAFVCAFPFLFSSLPLLLLLLLLCNAQWLILWSAAFPPRDRIECWFLYKKIKRDCDSGLAACEKCIIQLTATTRPWRARKANDKNLLTTYGNISKSTRQNPQAAARQTHAHRHRLRRRQQQRSGRVDKRRQRLAANGGVHSQQAQAQRKRATGERATRWPHANEEARSLAHTHSPSPPPSPSPSPSSSLHRVLLWNFPSSFRFFFSLSFCRLARAFLCISLFFIFLFIVLRFSFVINLQRCANYCLAATVSGKLANAGKLSTPKNRKKKQKKKPVWQLFTNLLLYASYSYSYQRPIYIDMCVYDIHIYSSIVTDLRLERKAGCLEQLFWSN